MILSIVIPVYNVVNYIERCLKSIISNNIDFLNIELVVVIDGSKDSSDILCEKILKGINNVKIIYQENKGLSGARNTGIKNASGDFIWFVDSDDSISENSISNFIENYDIIKQSKILKIGFDFILKDNSIVRYFSDALNENEVGFIKIKDYIELDNFKPMSWNYIFNKEFLLNNNLFFYEGIYHEDEEFIVRALYLVDKVLIFNKIFYHYFENSGSIMTNFKSKSTFDKLLIINLFEKLIENESIKMEYKNFIRKRVFIFYLTILQPKYFSNHTDNEKKMIVKELQKNIFYPFNDIEGLDFKNQLYLKLLNKSIFLYLTLRKTL